jgi:hypothetical protein
MTPFPATALSDAGGSLKAFGKVERGRAADTGALAATGATADRL